MEEALTVLLLADGGVKSLVSTSIHWGRAPQGEPTPYVVLQRISGIPDYTMQGPSGYVASRVQVDTYATNYLLSKQIARAVIGALSGHRDRIFQGFFVASERDLPVSDAGDVNALFRTSIDISIHHSE